MTMPNNIKPVSASCLGYLLVAPAKSEGLSSSTRASEQEQRRRGLHAGREGCSIPKGDRQRIARENRRIGWCN
jgi:hypothetical protein